MDRQGFLSSLPFLLPCPSAAWPPRRAASSAAASASAPGQEPETKLESLLVPTDNSYQFKISIEPKVAGEVPRKVGEIQPAFFGRPENDTNHFDPSMTDIQIAMESSLGVLTINDSQSQDDKSILQGRVLFVDGGGPTQSSIKSQTPSSLRHTPRSPKLESFPLFLYFKIDKEGVFQVDGKHLLQTEIVQPDEDSKLPPSLILVFSCCLFRIFPLKTPSPATAASDSDTPRNEWKTAALEALQVLEKNLRQLSRSSTSSAAFSPTSSLPSSNEVLGQRDGIYPTAGVGHSHSHSTGSSNSSRPRSSKKLKGLAKTENDNNLQDHHIVRKVRRQRDALTRSYAGLHSLEYLLESPASAIMAGHALSSLRCNNGGDDESQNLAETQVQGYTLDKSSKLSLVPLLSGITEDLTASYGSQVEKQEALHLYRQEIEEQNHQMDSLLDSYFPGMPQRHPGSGRRGSKSKRHSKSHGDNVVATDNEGGDKKTKSAEEVVKSVERLMNKQGALLKERSSLLVLPMRG